MQKREKKILIFCFAAIVAAILVFVIFYPNIRTLILKVPNKIEYVLNPSAANAASVDNCNNYIDSNFPISTNRDDFSYYKDNDYASFRPLNTAGLKEASIYRSSSPIDNTYGRSTQAMKALENAQIHNIINLDNTAEEALTLPGFKDSYYSHQNTLYAPITGDFTSSQDMEQIKKIFEFINSCDGSVLIHSTDGCDKTAVVCALLSCLETSSYDYIKADYYQSYYSLRPILQNQDTRQLRANIDQKFRIILAPVLDLKYSNIIYSNLNLYTEEYLAKCGLTKDDIRSVSNKLEDDSNN